MIADECQTGLGRTGRFLASQTSGVLPNYIVLSKALGGGLAKISAVMIERRRYQSQFDLLHTSTFGDDEFSSTVALKTLELLDADTLKACRDKGQWLRHRLLALMRKYEGTLADVRGDGLLLGIELQKRSSASSFVLRFLSNSGLLGFLVAGYLLRIHDIRVAPTLSDRLTLRVQPSALIRFEQLDRFVHAMEDVCARLHDEDVVGLTRFLHHADTTDYDVPTISNPDQKFFTYAPISAPEEQPSDDWEPVARVAWLFHLVDESDLIHLEPAFHEFSSRARNAYLNRFASFAEPVLMSSIDVRSRIGDCVRVYPLLLPVTSSRLRRTLVRQPLASGEWSTQCWSPAQPSCLPTPQPSITPDG